MKILTPLFFLVFTASMVSAQKLKFGQDFVQPSGSYLISVIHDDRSKWALAVSSHRIFNSSFLFSTYAVTDREILKKVNRHWVRDSIFVKINLDAIVEKYVKGRIKSPISYDQKAKKNILTIRATAWISVDSDNSNYYGLSFGIEASFINQTGSKTWKEIYGYSVPDTKPLFGIGSLTAENGKFLRAWAELGLSKCVETLFIDLKGSNAKLETGLIMPKELSSRYPE